MVARLGNISALKDFLAFLATVRGDISHITAPPFILAPQSLTEFPSYWAERPSLFTAAAHESSAEKRILVVLKLYLASLQRQYYVGRSVKEGLKKPLNPFLGELFFCEYTDHVVTAEKASASTVRVISEQVSHHPPTTACYLSADEHGVHAEAYSTQHTTLSGTSVMIRQSGHALLTVDKYNETYLLPLPDVWARSVLSGVPWPELDGKYKILSSNGYTAEMRFTAKKLWGGVRNMFEASIYRTADTDKNSLYFLSGSWSSSFSIFNSKGDETETFDLSEPKNQPVLMSIKPLEEQSPWESRRAWGATFEAIRKADNGAVVHEKSKLENAQRQMRRHEQKEGKKWETMFFTRRDGVERDDEDVVERIFDQLDTTEVERLRGTHGCWRFDKEKEERWKNGQGAWRPESPFG
ncbi:uncharacterized protein Z518_01533 [Rhinocladiella mackenziei CBS 650.93]|uniref:Oxysterol-binding protein n=1 Tax=Rhinocladiella mackenziei CBS 650.93 TaxID=1442369 RepID=A0A0D2JLV7_9EURO|nr:uncharacterized protein Z518_01533 [Rhinocladiella mackenziei CBS 650.93]KIX10450.1 hypothetical protein Z518_01533 [Rhinocladiella mackenziei CBS 650.93]